MLKAALVVQSEALSVSELALAMGIEPDDGYDRGSLSPHGHIRRWASWSITLDLTNARHAGTAGLTTAIESLGDEIAERAAALVERGCDVVLSVCQELTDDVFSHGLHLSAGAVTWLASARATFDVDQYVEDGRADA